MGMAAPEGVNLVLTVLIGASSLLTLAAGAYAQVRPLPFWFPYFVLIIAVVVIPATWILGRSGAWSRLAERYPAVSAQDGRRVDCAFLVVGRTTYKLMARLTVGPSHLHVSMGLHLRPGYPTFSIPWSDITATRDTWPWSLPPAPVVRLTLARDRQVRFLIRPRVAEEVVAASGGQLAITEARAS
jgi:hypothetical protein